MRKCNDIPNEIIFLLQSQRSNYTGKGHGRMTLCFAMMHGPVSPGVSGFDNILFFFVVVVSQEKASFFVFTLFFSPSA